MSNEKRATNNEHAEQLDALLDALDAIPPEEHEDYLARVCPDPELRRKALALLAAETDSRGFLSRLADGMVPKLEEPPDLSGRRIGAYELVKPLGQGGMGVVYEARRADGAFEQHVAVKLLTTALAGTGARKQFLVERQILAGLEHPAIARIIDGGVTEDGTPWFAMEHVHGMPIDAYCDRHQLSIRERLELFLQVCDAVEHAHRRLVVHRDVKPANVLVTDDHQVKMLDFGIAKLLDTDAAAPATRTALRLMTPEYASPEQVRGEAVTTASDVYQLGLLLYELLSGHRPYALRRRTTSELERVICEQPPTRLSTAVTREDAIVLSPGGATNPVDELCRIRKTTRKRLRRRLRGDLENIVGKALSKEPERRYGSADRLALDIRRHLNNLPVMARPDTMVYRTRKFLQRHALGAAATITVLFLIAGMTGFYTVRIQAERDVAKLERDRAEAEAVKAQQMNELLAGLFRSADPREARGAELTARELLDRGVEQIDHELEQQPDVLADMLQVLGDTYSALGIFDSAESLLNRALEIRRNRLGPAHVATASVLTDLGNLQFRKTEYGQARETLEVAAGIIEASAGSDAPELVEVLTALGQIYSFLGEFNAATEALERALQIQVRISGEQSTPVAEILRSMCMALLITGELEQAENRCAQALALQEQGPDADHPGAGIILSSLAIARLHQGKLDGVEDLFRRDIKIQQQAYGPNHRQVAFALGELGNFLLKTGRHAEALEVLQQAVSAASTGTNSVSTAAAPSLARLGDLHWATGHYNEARDYYRRSVAIRVDAFGQRRFDLTLAYALDQLGGMEKELGNEDAAAQNFEHALKLWQQAPQTVDPELASSLPHLARWLIEQQRCAEALPLFDKVLQGAYARQSTAKELVETLESLLAECRG